MNSRYTTHYRPNVGPEIYKDDCIISAEEAVYLLNSSAWVSVEERLPDALGHYEVWFDYTSPPWGHTLFDGDQFVNGAGVRLDPYPTHWRRIRGPA